MLEGQSTPMAHYWQCHRKRWAMATNGGNVGGRVMKISPHVATRRETRLAIVVGGGVGETGFFRHWLLPALASKNPLPFRGVLAHSIQQVHFRTDLLWYQVRKNKCF
jgi:hypothetical protein